MWYKEALSTRRALVAYAIVIGAIAMLNAWAAGDEGGIYVTQATLGAGAVTTSILALFVGTSLGAERRDMARTALLRPISRERYAWTVFGVDIAALCVAYIGAAVIIIATFQAAHGFPPMDRHGVSLLTCVVLPLGAVLAWYGLTTACSVTSRGSRVEILDSADGHRYVTHGPEFDPTWDGSYRVLSHQLINNHCSNRAQAQSSPAPEPSVPTPPADARLRTIAIVRVLGPGIYNIEDRGSVACPDGDAGRALHLWSRNKNPNHQLSDVIIDRQNLRFCMVRLDQRADAGLGFDGTWEVHYGDVGGYWMQRTVISRAPYVR